MTREWIAHNGGSCPLPDGAKHEVMFRDGDAMTDDRPNTWDWAHNMGSGDIIAYRLCEPESPHWDGETWPPEVGAWIEARDSYGKHQRCRVAGREGNQVWLDFEDDGYATGHLDDLDARPIRTAEDKAVEAMIENAVNQNLLLSPLGASAIYRAIAAGEIPGVRLEGERVG